MLKSIEATDLLQMQAIRKKWLPTESDTELGFAQALWLEKKYWENLSVACANGVAKAFG